MKKVFVSILSLLIFHGLQALASYNAHEDDRNPQKYYIFKQTQQEMMTADQVTALMTTLALNKHPDVHDLLQDCNHDIPIGQFADRETWVIMVLQRSVLKHGFKVTNTPEQFFSYIEKAYGFDLREKRADHIWEIHAHSSKIHYFPSTPGQYLHTIDFQDYNEVCTAYDRLTQFQPRR